MGVSQDRAEGSEKEGDQQRGVDGMREKGGLSTGVSSSSERAAGRGGDQRESAHCVVCCESERDGPECGGFETGLWGGSDGLGGGDCVDGDEE